MRRRADELQAENAGLVRESEGRMEVIRTMMTKVWGEGGRRCGDGAHGGHTHDTMMTQVGVGAGKVSVLSGKDDSPERER